MTIAQIDELRKHVDTMHRALGVLYDPSAGAGRAKDYADYEAGCTAYRAACSILQELYSQKVLKKLNIKRG
mgnify:CR=1 FL=1